MLAHPQAVDTQQKSKETSMSTTSIYTSLASIPHNPHFLNRYFRFISNYLDQVRIPGATENHHILPKSMFPDNANLNLNKWNKVVLTTRQHFIAHWLLWKAYPQTNMRVAFYRMTHCKSYSEKITSRVFNNLRKQANENMSEFNVGHRWAHNGTHSIRIEPGCSIPKGMKPGRHKSSTVGTKCFNNGVFGIHVKIGDDVPEGFVPGNLINKGKIRYNNGITEVRLSPGQPAPEGFVFGARLFGVGKRGSNR